LKTVLTCGFNYNGYTKKINFFGFIADAPARAFLKCIKPHQSYYACEKCTVKGIYDKDRVCFPDRSCELRTDSSFRLQTQPEHHISITPLTEIPNFDVIKCVPLDYMHLCTLGITKKLLNLFVRGPIKKDKLDHLDLLY